MTKYKCTILTIILLYSALCTNAISQLLPSGAGSYAIYPPQGANYLMSTFHNSAGSAKLLIFGSLDGITWNQWGATYSPCTGVLRDPNIAWDVARNQMLLATTNVAAVGVSTLSFDVGVSANGHDFTCVTSVDCSSVVSGANAVCWGPAWIYNQDGSLWYDSNGIAHIICAASNTGTTVTGFDLYETHPISMANLAGAWSALVKITGTGLPSNIIQTYPMVVGSNLTLWSTTGGKINEMTSTLTLLTSGYTVTQATVGVGVWPSAEAADLIVPFTSPNVLRAYFGIFASGINTLYSESSDGGITWTTPQSVATPIHDPTNGTVIPNPFR